MECVIAPSILAADHGRLAEELLEVERAGADWIHVDVMDGHFVPNLTFGPPVIKSIRSATSLPFDVHLMIEKPELSISQYVKAGANRVTVHAETCPHLERTLNQIKEEGALAGVSLNPSTSAEAIRHVMHVVDLVLVMTVNPGFGGQKFIEPMLDKVRAVREMIDSQSRPIRLEVDGGVSTTTIQRVYEAGADTFVAGSAVFGAQDYGQVIGDLRAKAGGTKPPPSTQS